MARRPLNEAQLRQEREQGTPYEWNEYDDLSAELADLGYPIDLRLSPAEALTRQVEAAGAAVEELRRLRAAEAEAPALRTLADEGRRYRADLLEDALREGKLAQGDSFSEAAYRQLLEDAPIETLKRVRDDWRRSTRLRTGVSQTAARQPIRN